MSASSSTEQLKQQLYFGLSLVDKLRQILPIVTTEMFVDYRTFNVALTAAIEARDLEASQRLVMNPPRPMIFIRISNWLDEINWSNDGLVPVIAQQAETGKVMMFAWMNREALNLSATTGYAVYWSRSRQKLWHKGEESGHRQKIIDILFDCDEDVILLKIQQEGGIACHTGRESCFYRHLKNLQWLPFEPILKDPNLIYKKNE